MTSFRLSRYGFWHSPTGTLTRISNQSLTLVRIPTTFGRALTWSLMLSAVAMAVLSKSSASYVWDDSFMFVRYADNIIKCHQIAWNPCGSETYGLSSLLFLVVVVPIRLLFPEEPALCAFLSSVIGGFAFLFLLIALIERNVRAGPIEKQIIASTFALGVKAWTDEPQGLLHGGLDNLKDSTFALGVKEWTDEPQGLLHGGLDNLKD